MSRLDERIVIVGAGVFGLSTALHLRRRGYEHVTVFDYQPYNENHYDPERGCDSASSDLNKIYRCSYGEEKEYQSLAYSGRPIWVEWNETIASADPSSLPPGITNETKIFEPSGFLRLANGPVLSEYDQECLKSLEAAGLRDHEHVLSDDDDMARLKESEAADPSTHWQRKLDAFKQVKGKHDGFLDTSAGLTYADKACVWARHLCEKAGVEFVLGPKTGRLEELVREGEKVTGIKTADGRTHDADLVIVACGPWTPSIVQETNGSLEATGGSVVTITLPKERKDLWEKYAPESFPVWAYGLTGHVSQEYGGFYGFPRTEKGVIKIGYRGKKWTNFQKNSKFGKMVSTPQTRYTETKHTNLPESALSLIKRIIQELFPDLMSIGITDTRLCWYTDSFDNSFMIDYVPGYGDSLFVASAGSGHGFKFLPVLGMHVVDQIERKPNDFTELWKWRTPKPGAHANGLEEGEKGSRNLPFLKLATVDNWKWPKDDDTIVDHLAQKVAQL